MYYSTLYCMHIIKSKKSIKWARGVRVEKVDEIQ